MTHAIITLLAVARALWMLIVGDNRVMCPDGLWIRHVGSYAATCVLDDGTHGRAGDDHPPVSWNVDLPWICTAPNTIIRDPQDGGVAWCRSYRSP